MKIQACDCGLDLAGFVRLGFSDISSIWVLLHSLVPEEGPSTVGLPSGKSCDNGLVARIGRRASGTSICQPGEHAQSPDQDESTALMHRLQVWKQCGPSLCGSNMWVLGPYMVRLSHQVVRYTSSPLLKYGPIRPYDICIVFNKEQLLA